MHLFDSIIGNSLKRLYDVRRTKSLTTLVWWLSTITIIIQCGYIIRRNRYAYFRTFFRSVVRLSVVCHIRAPCLNRSMDLHVVIWQIHLCAHDTLCYRRALAPSEKRDLNANCEQTVSFMMPPSKYKRSDFAYC